MTTPTENEAWLIDCGADIIEKKAQVGVESLSAWERLVYCLWVADYSMRNAGDLQTARDVYSSYRNELICQAKQLGLSNTTAAFALSDDDLEREYDSRFEDVCDEIKKAEPKVR